MPAAVARVLILIWRSASGVEAIASIAFMMRLSRTCCNCTGSPNTAGRLARQIGLDRDPPRDQLMTQQGGCRLDQLVEINGLKFALALLEQAAQPLNDLSGAVILLHDVLQRTANFLEVRCFRRQQMERRLRIRQNRGERLIDFVGDRT